MTALSSAAVLQARTFRMRSLRNARTVFTSQSSGLVCGRVIPLDSYARRILVAMMIDGAGIPRESSAAQSVSNQPPVPAGAPGIPSSVEFFQNLYLSEKTQIMILQYRYSKSLLAQNPATGRDFL